MMATIKRWLGLIPNPELTHAIEDHRQAVKEFRATTQRISSLSKDVQKNAAQAITLINRTWGLNEHERF